MRTIHENGLRGNAHIGFDERPLSKSDLENFARSWITPDLAQQAGLFRVDSATGGQLVGRNGKGDYSGIVFPYIWPGSDSPREYRLRRDHPELEAQADGTTKEKGKYLAPPGRGNMLYFAPDATPEMLAEVLLPVAITEGEKKTLALSRLAWHDLGDAEEKPRWLAVGLSGAWNWRGVVGKDTNNYRAYASKTLRTLSR